MTESSDSFQTTEPPAPIPEQPKPPKRGRRTLLIGVAAAVVVAGLGVGAWWAITTHNELNDTRTNLEATQGELAALQAQSSEQIGELESQSAGLQSDLDDRTTALAALQTEHDQLVADHEQLVADHEQLVSESTALTAANGDLSAAIDSVSLDLESARAMAEAIAAYMMPVGSSVNSRLLEPALAVRDELAVLIGWFENGEDYDFHAWTAWMRFSSAIEDLDDEALTEAFQTYADAANGSAAEINAWAEWVARLMIDTLETIDQALQTGAAALAE